MSRELKPAFYGAFVASTEFRLVSYVCMYVCMCVCCKRSVDDFAHLFGMICTFAGTSSLFFVVDPVRPVSFFF